MTPNPILKVLSTFQKHKVKALLIGGQACIIYGAAEFSRDSDFVVLSNSENLGRLKRALKTLKARRIYVPPLEADYLEQGHACHFRCQSGDVKNLRVDIIANLRGCAPFDELWRRRKTISLKSGKIDIIGLEDLVQSKKTQRDKDWLMLRRLVEDDIAVNGDKRPDENKIKWWLLESRNADSLVRLAKKYPKTAKECAAQRPLLTSAISMNIAKIDLELGEEETAERRKDAAYWVPLRKELELLRHKQATQK